jgi:hypothetical protein
LDCWLHNHIADLPRDASHRQLNEDGDPVVAGSRVRAPSNASDDSNGLSNHDFESANDFDDAKTYAFVDQLGKSMREIARHATQIMLGTSPYMTRRSNALEVLGSVTMFCCLDNQGILSENEASADHILLLDHHAKPVILDLINDPDSASGMVSNQLSDPFTIVFYFRNTNPNARPQNSALKENGVRVYHY